MPILDVEKARNRPAISPDPVAAVTVATIVAQEISGSTAWSGAPGATVVMGAALGAEGVGKDVELLIGNGYARGHADLTLDLLRHDPKLRALFEKRYG